MRVDAGSVSEFLLRQAMLVAQILDGAPEGQTDVGRFIAHPRQTINSSAACPHIMS